MAPLQRLYTTTPARKAPEAPTQPSFASEIFLNSIIIISLETVETEGNTKEFMSYYLLIRLTVIGCKRLIAARAAGGGRLIGG